MKLSETIKGKVPRETLRAVMLEERRSRLVTAKRQAAFRSERWKRLNSLVARVSLAVEMAWRKEASARIKNPQRLHPLKHETAPVPMI